MASKSGFESKADFKEAYRLLEKYGKQKDLTKWFRGYLTPALTSWFKQQFMTRGATFGTPWKPISDSTVSIRKSLNARAPWGWNAPMVSSGRALNAFTKTTGPDAIRVYTPYNMLFGSSLPYLDYHHRPQGFTVTHVFGRPLRKPTHVDPRPIVPAKWPGRILGQWADSLIRYIQDEEGWSA